MTGTHRVTAGERVRRLLAIVPWVAARDGPTIAEVCERFGVSREQLLADLEVVFLVGVYPFTPDELIDVTIEGDRVWIRFAEYFARPLRLTPDQALALVAAGSSLLATPGTDADGPLARGLTKLAGALGVAEGVSVRLGEAEPEILERLRRAVDEHRAVEIDYYTYGRDQRTSRVVRPYRVAADSGQWYLSAYCTLVEGDRLFRVDRIEQARLLDDRFEPPAALPELQVFSPQAGDPRVVLDLDPEALWVTEQYPVESVVARPGGGARVELVVSAAAWLERLLIRLGPSAEVVAAEPPLDVDLAAGAARRILARYGRAAPPPPL